MDLIAHYQNAGFEAVADGVMAFSDRRMDLQKREAPGQPARVQKMYGADA